MTRSRTVFALTLTAAALVAGPAVGQASAYLYVNEASATADVCTRNDAISRFWTFFGAPPQPHGGNWSYHGWTHSDAFRHLSTRVTIFGQHFAIVSAPSLPRYRVRYTAVVVERPNGSTYCESYSHWSGPETGG